MKFILVALFGLVGLAILPCESFAQERGSLYGLAATIDPGHGGKDPGSSRMHRGARVTEDEYVYDVAVRVRRLSRERQGIASLTITDAVGERNFSPSQVFPDSRTERFALDGTLVHAGQGGLNKRLAFGNLIRDRYPKHRRVWISIHFDVTGSSASIEGVRIIAADTASRLAQALKKSFGADNRLRDEAPLVGNGDPAHGIRNLAVLRSANKHKDRVLIELGNFNNDSDLWRIRDPKVREAYALAIVRALEQY